MHKQNFGHYYEIISYYIIKKLKYIKIIKENILIFFVAQCIP